MPHYEKPPITEAIIDLRIQPELSVIPDLSGLTEIDSHPRYTKKNNFWETVSEIVIGPATDTGTTVQRKLVGHIYKSDDRKFAFQSRLSGFTLSRFAVYDRWEHFQGEAQRLWTTYRELAKPGIIQRLAVRTINRLDIPSEGFFDFSRYLCAHPDLPERFSQVQGFLMRTQSRLPNINGELVLTEAMVPPAREGVVSVILDTDISVVKDVPQDEEGIWDLFEKLRKTRNDVFEACITNDARNIFGRMDE